VVFRRRVAGAGLDIDVDRVHCFAAGRAVRCERLFADDVRCSLGWRIARFVYSGRARFVQFIDNDELDWYYTFRGTRKKAGCKSCRGKRPRWV